MSDDKPTKTLLGLGAETASSGNDSSVEAAGPTLPGGGPQRAPADTNKTIPGRGQSSPEAATVLQRQVQGGAPAPIPAPGSDPFVGREFSGYVVQRKLAEGGMGIVYVAEHAKIGKTAAVKVLKLEYCRDDTVVQRFYQEARAVNEIRHENIVEIYDFGRDDEGRVYFVMELLEGQSLDARLNAGPMPWPEVQTVIEQIVRGLKAAHAKGFIHRDLKPENIWLRQTPDGLHVKLLDFGIAKLVGMENAEDKLTRTGSIIGTPDYMSPEQINGSVKIDHRSDIYSLGVILYEIVSGTRPFSGDTLNAIITGHVLHAPPPMTELKGGTPPQVEAIIHRMLAKSPDERYQSVDDVLADVKDVAANRAPSKLTTLNENRPISAAPAARAAAATPRKRSAAPIVAAVIAVLALAGGGGAYWWYTTRDKTESAGTQTTEQQPAQTRDDNTPTQVVDEPPPGPSPVNLEEARDNARGVIHSSLEDSEPKVRVGAADAVGEVRDRESVPSLMKLAGEDPDAEVKGHAASALGRLGVDAAAQKKLEDLHDDAEPALAAWYAEALARMGNKRARRKLTKYAGDKDLAVSFKASMALADLSEPGDKKAIKALQKLATREAELNDIAPYAGVAIMTRLARLGLTQARDALYAALKHSNEGARLAAAEGLAKIGDDAGSEVLAASLADEGSSNRVAAAAGLVELGNYSGYELLQNSLDDNQAPVRSLSARALGEVGEKDSLRALIGMYDDTDKTVRLAAAVAVLRIVGLDPVVLAQASVDWASSALASDNWAVREAAAGTLGEIPETEAVPLLAQAIADPDAKVRRAASRSARKMRGKKAAKAVAAAAQKEKDPEAQEQQVRALAAIGQPEAKPALEEIAKKTDRVGVIASGSLIALGEKDNVNRLQSAIANPQSKIRQAAIEGAVVGNDIVVLPVLDKGVEDKKFEVRFNAATALAIYHKSKDRAMPVLREGLASRDTDVVGKARAAFLRFGEEPPGYEPKDTVDAPDAEDRLAAIVAIAAMTWEKAAPLLRRLANDSDTEVKRAAIDAVREFETDHKDQVVRFYKSFVEDSDAVARTKSRARLAELLTDPNKPKQPPVAPTPDPTPPTPAPDLTGVQAALDGAKTARESFDKSAEAVAKIIADIEAKTRDSAKDDDDIDAVEDLGKDLDAAQDTLSKAKSRLDKAAAAVKESAGDSPSDDAKSMIADARKLGKIDSEASKLDNKVKSARRRIKSYVQAETADPGVYLAAADAAIATGKLSSARRDLRRAEKIFKQTGKVDPHLYFSYGRLYHRMAVKASSDDKRRDYLTRAKRNYDKYASRGSGKRVSQAKQASAEIAGELNALDKTE